MSTMIDRTPPAFRAAPVSISSFIENDGHDVDRRLEASERSEALAHILGAQVDKHLACQVCYEIVPPPVEQCSSGHLICGSCTKRLASKPQCPTCAVDITQTTRNLVLERMVKKCWVECRYSGCGKKVRHEDLAKHLKTCTHQPVKCHKCDCVFDTWEEVLEHLQVKHKWTFREGHGDLLLRKHWRLSMKEGKSQGIFQFTHFGVNVVLVMQYCAKRHNFYFTAYEIGRPSGTKFRICAKAPDGSSHVKAVIPALSYRQLKRNQIVRKNCFVISEEVLESMLDDEGNFIYSFHFVLPE